MLFTNWDTSVGNNSFMLDVCDCEFVRAVWTAVFQRRWHIYYQHAAPSLHLLTCVVLWYRREVNWFQESCLLHNHSESAPLYNGAVHIKQGLNGVLSPSSDRQADTHDSFFFFFIYILSTGITLFSTFLLTDPEVFLMLLHNSFWCCIATVQVSLYVTGEGDFSKGRTGGSNWWCWCQCFSSGWVVRLGSFGGDSWRVLDIWVMDWWIAGWMIDDW